jgi:hypothetical protein
MGRDGGLSTREKGGWINEIQVTRTKEMRGADFIYYLV